MSEPSNHESSNSANDSKNERIIDLFWNRSETAIGEASREYGRYCYSISYNILRSIEDAEECVNDTWLRTWNAIPPQRPGKLAFFVGRIVRNLSLDKFRSKKAKRRGGEMAPMLEELSEAIPGGLDTESIVLGKELGRAINGFLRTLPETACNLFLARYWHSMPIAEMADIFGVKENNIKASLFRTRGKLKEYLEKEGMQP